MIESDLRLVISTSPNRNVGIEKYWSTILFDHVVHCRLHGGRNGNFNGVTIVFKFN